MAGMSKQMIVVLDTIRSAYNVGAIFRTCDGAGVQAVWLTGYTPAPTDRFGRQQPEIHKTSVGASQTVPWVQYKQVELIKELRIYQQQGFVVVAVEQTDTAVSLPIWQVPEKVIYIFGNEIDGVAKELLAVADVDVDIPMYGQKESLNVSVSAGIILYH